MQQFLKCFLGWAPSYEIRSKGINSPINLTYKAKIFQNTNESWSNVQLSLSRRMAK
ncbi:DUF4139 domain-containing protein [bacterium]|nr:DUF4139 domain-containing protein [bacterium]